MVTLVAVLGATGAVGQSFIRLLADHPWFELAEVAASERSAGRSYTEAASWIGDDPIPQRVAGLTVTACDPRVVRSPVVFSALDSSVAGEAEAAFARAGRHVLSNAKNYRMEPDVPLVVAEVNPDHLDILPAQRSARGWSGDIVTNGNCAAIAAVLDEEGRLLIAGKRRLGRHLALMLEDRTPWRRMVRSRGGLVIAGSIVGGRRTCKTRDVPCHSYLYPQRGRSR